MSIETSDDVGLLQTHIRYLERELKKQRDENLKVFMAAAIASTPHNYHPETAVIRAQDIAIRCVEALK
jgi:hypothetical protein